MTAFFIFLSLATLAQNRTIPRKPPTLLPYERSVGFASLRNSGRSTSGIHARPLSKVRCCRPKEFGRLPEGLSHQPFAPHHPFKNRTILRKSPTLLPYERSVGFASLRNSGRSTSGIHARPLSKVRCCRPKEFGRLPEGLSHQPFAPHHPFKNRTILRKSPTPLPPLSKGGGLTARHKLLSCCVLIATHLPFLFTKLFCRQDGGIVSVASTLSIPTTLAKGQ